MNNRGRRRRWVLLAGCILLAMAALSAGLVAWLGKPKPIPPEKIVQVERGDIARSVVAVGRIEPLSKVEIKSKANGIIQSLLVDVGDLVVEGQVLAELDKEDLDAQVREAKAGRDAEQASLEVALASESRARIEAMHPELEFVQRDHGRIKALVADRIASPQALDEAEKAQAISLNRQQLLEAAVRSAGALVTQARARAAAAEASLDRAEENQRHATIRSPIRGLVLTRDVEVGDAVSSILNLGSAATLILTLGDVSSVYVEGQVDESDVGRIRTDLPVRTTVESFPGEVFGGLVTRIAPMGRERDNVTTFDVRVSIANPQGRLRVNMSANAEIILEDRQGVLLVPEAALNYDREKKPSLNLLDPAMRTGFRQVAVVTGISNGQRTEVLEGVAEGDRLVLP